MKYIPLNFAILLNPVNWVIVWLMLAFFVFAVAYVRQNPMVE